MIVEKITPQYIFHFRRDGIMPDCACALSASMASSEAGTALACKPWPGLGNLASGSASAERASEQAGLSRPKTTLQASHVVIGVRELAALRDLHATRMLWIACQGNENNL